MNADSKRLLRDLAVDLLGSSLFRGYKITIGAFAIHASSGWDSAGFTEEDTMESIAQQFAGDGRHTEEIRRLRVAGGIVIADRDTIQGPLLIHPVVITLASFTFMSPEQKREVYAYTRYTHT
jgi:2-iminoacetate synthase ThiH